MGLTLTFWTVALGPLRLARPTNAKRFGGQCDKRLMRPRWTAVNVLNHYTHGLLLSRAFWRTNAADGLDEGSYNTCAHTSIERVLGAAHFVRLLDIIAARGHARIGALIRRLGSYLLARNKQQKSEAATKWEHQARLGSIHWMIMAFG